MENRKFVIAGLVKDRKTGKGMEGLRVEAWEHGHVANEGVGRPVTTDAQGRFTLAFHESYYRGLFGACSADLFFRVLRGNALLTETDVLVHQLGQRGASAPTRFDIDITVDDAGGAAVRRQGAYTVRGTIREQDGRLVQGAVVRLFRKTGAQELLVGEAVSGKTGKYEIRYASWSAEGAQGDTGGGSVTVRATRNNFTGLAAEGTTGQPSAEEVIHLVFEATDTERANDAGLMVKGCRIDLPPGDVVEKVEYEQIILTRNRMAQLKESWGSLWPELPSSAWEELASYPLALYVPFEQEWALQGYMRGRLVKTFTLAPGEEQTVEVFTWDRMKTGLESTSTLDSEQSTESTGTRRDAMDVTSDVARQSGFQFSTNAKVGFTISGVNVDMTQNTNTTEAVNNHVTTASHSISEATTKSAGKVRTNRTVKVTESREYGSEERVTRKLRNANAFHTLTLPFFEVLAKYGVTTRLRADDIQIVALMVDAEHTLDAFTRDTIRLHERALRTALLDRDLEPGLAAARFLDAMDRSSEVLCMSCACPDDPQYQSRSWRKVAQSAESVAQWNQRALQWMEYSDKCLLSAAACIARDNVRDILQRIVPPHPDQGARNGLINKITKDIQQELDNALILGLFKAATEAKTYIKSYLLRTALKMKLAELESFLLTTLQDPLVAITEIQADRLGRILSTCGNAVVALQYDQDIAALVHGKIYNCFLLHAPKFILPVPDPMMQLLLNAIGGAVISAELTNNVEGSTGFQNYDAGGVVSLLKSFSTYYEAWDKEQTADEAARKEAAEQARTDRQERMGRILSAFGLRETAEARERLDALLQHLQQNFDHYRFAIANERPALFANADTMPLVTHGILGATPIGCVNDRFAVPVHPAPGSQLATTLATIKEALLRQVLPDVREHILPTAALYSEAIVGTCNGAEAEAIERFQADTKKKMLENEAQALEVERLQARLTAHPPLLDKDPVLPAHVDVRLGDEGDTPKS